MRIQRNQHFKKKKLINRTTVFASLNRFLHNSHFKLSLKTSKSTSISSRPGLVDAFWPRRRRFVVVVVVLVVLVVAVVAVVAVAVVVVLTSIFFVVVVCVCVVSRHHFFSSFFQKHKIRDEREERDLRDQMAIGKTKERKKERKKTNARN